MATNIGGGDAGPKARGLNKLGREAECSAGGRLDGRR